MKINDDEDLEDIKIAIKDLNDFIDKEEDVGKFFHRSEVFKDFFKKFKTNDLEDPAVVELMETEQAKELTAFIKNLAEKYTTIHWLLYKHASKRIVRELNIVAIPLYLEFLNEASIENENKSNKGNFYEQFQVRMDQLMKYFSFEYLKICYGELEKKDSNLSGGDHLTIH